MGSSFISSAITLLVMSLLMSPSLGVTFDVLATICSQTQNQETCENILMKDPRTNSADLPLLSLISIELTMNQTTNNSNTFEQLIHDNTTTDLSFKTGLENCVTLYGDIQEKLKTAYNLSQQRKYKNITELGQLSTLAYTCENGLPLNSPTAAFTEDMLLTCQSAESVNEYVGGYGQL